MLIRVQLIVGGWNRNHHNLRKELLKKALHMAVLLRGLSQTDLSL